VKRVGRRERERDMLGSRFLGGGWKWEEKKLVMMVERWEILTVGHFSGCLFRDGRLVQRTIDQSRNVSAEEQDPEEMEMHDI
jgi:hypothetical protein